MKAWEPEEGGVPSVERGGVEPQAFCVEESRALPPSYREKEGMSWETGMCRWCGKNR